MEKELFFKKLEKSRMCQLVIFCVLEAMILVFYIIGAKWAERAGRKSTINDMPIGVDYEIASSIESVKDDNGKVKFSGWVLRSESKNVEVDIVLQPTDGKEAEVLFADIEKRGDVVEYFDLNQSYEKSGFDAEIKSSKLKDDICYEILISLLYEESGNRNTKKISTKRYLYNKEIYTYNPKEFVKPELKESLCGVVENGEIWGYSKEEGTWIYCLENKIYYIVEKNKMIALEKVPSIPFGVTTLEEGLKKEYQAMEVYISNEHYVEGNEGEYYMVEFELPEETLYIDIGTFGNRGDGWIYKQIFQKNIEIN